MDIQLVSRRTEDRSPVTIPSQTLRRRTNEAGPSKQSHSGPSKQSHSGPSKHSKASKPPGTLPMLRFPSPVDRNGKPIPKNENGYPRVDLQLLGPGMVSTSEQRQRVPFDYYARLCKENPVRVEAGAETYGRVVPPTADHPYPEHSLRAHAQGSTAQLTIDVPQGGRGNYIKEDRNGNAVSWQVGGGARASVSSTSQAPRGAHVYGSVTRGGRIIVTASNAPPQPAYRRP